MKRVLASLLCILMLLTAMPLVSAANVETPAADTAYKFGMIQGNVSETSVYYLAGGMSGYYMATTTNINEAIDVYLESTSGGYYFYTNANGAKSYINMVPSADGAHVNGAYEAAPSTVYTYDAAAGTVIATVNEVPYWFGTRNDKSYTTVGPCAVEYAGFYCQFYAADGSGAPEQPDLPAEPDVEELSIADAIALGASFPHNTYTTNKYKVTGVISAVTNATYGNMKLADAAGNELTIYGTWSADGTIRYDAMAVKPVAGDTVTIYGQVGQYNDAAQIKNGWIVAHTPGEGGGDTPVNPPVDGGISIDFTDKANRVTYTSSQQVWTQNGITVTNDKGASTTNVADYASPARFYKSSTVKIEYPGMTKIFIDSVTYDDNDYAIGWTESFTDANATATVVDGDVTIVFANAVDSFTWPELTSQSRAYKITVYTGENGGDIGGGDTPVNPDPEPGDDPDITDDYTASIDFTDKANRVSYSGEQQVWAQNGITVTNDKAASSNPVGDYGGEGYPVRFYKGSAVTVAYQGMTKIVFICDDYKDTYATDLAASITEGAVSVDGTVVTVTFDAPVDSLYIAELAAQVRVHTIYVWGEGGDTPVEPPVEYVGTIEVATVNGAAGETVNVTVTLPNNPGIVSAKVKVLFDSSVLKFVGYEAGNFAAGGYSWGDPAGANEKGYFIINWCDAINPDSTADLLATLSFEIPAGTEEGFTAITAEFSCADDVYNANEETIWLSPVDGGVNIVNAIPGDANGDGKVNNRDLGILQQWLNDRDPKGFVKEAADLNGDGKVNNRDLGMLQKELNK